MFKKLSYHEMQCLYNPLYLANINMPTKIIDNKEEIKIESKEDYQSTSDYESSESDEKINIIKSKYKKFIEENKDKIKEKIECVICKGSYTYFNKSKHNKTKRHLKFINDIYN